MRNAMACSVLPTLVLRMLTCSWYTVNTWSKRCIVGIQRYATVYKGIQIYNGVQYTLYTW